MYDTTATTKIDGLDVRVGIINNSFWLLLPFGISTPLASCWVEDGDCYCYFGTGQGVDYQETRIYRDGTVVG